MSTIPLDESLAGIRIGVAVSHGLYLSAIDAAVRYWGWAGVTRLTSQQIQSAEFWESGRAPEILVIDSAFIAMYLGGYEGGDTRQINNIPWEGTLKSRPSVIIFNETKWFRLVTRDGQRIDTQIIAGPNIEAVIINLEQQAMHRRNLQEILKELRMTQRELVERLAMSIEARDQTTGSHVRRMQKYARLLAEKSGLVPPEEYELLEQATALHDIGKLAIMDCILSKPKKLDSNEYAIIQTHSIEGAKILATRHGGLRMPLLEKCCEVACSHHEKWDGSGYPHGLRESQIPMWGRLVAVVDVFDALVSDRPYKVGWEFEKAIEEIKKGGSNGQFDPNLAKIFIDNRDEVENIYNKFKEEEEEQKKQQEELERKLKSEGKKPPHPPCR
ncbi:MAG: HD domain-containing protein [Magnetococcus sp. DMHC-1]